MQKQELTHVHGLLVVIRRHLAEQGGTELPEDAFAEYDDHGVGPTAIGERKAVHEEAVGHLITGFHTALPTQQRPAEESKTSSETSVQ